MSHIIEDRVSYLAVIPDMEAVGGSARRTPMEETMVVRRAVMIFIERYVNSIGQDGPASAMFALRRLEC